VIQNALRHTPEGGEVLVSLSLEGEEGRRAVRVRVADSGKGIPEVDLPHLFDPFFRGTGRRRGSTTKQPCLGEWSGTGFATPSRTFIRQGATAMVGCVPWRCGRAS
jgi:signal transduction histidine kinase